MVVAMTSRCAGCGAALNVPRARACGACGLRVGDLPSNVAELRAREAHVRRTHRGLNLRPLLLVLVLGVLLSLGWAVGASASDAGIQPTLAAVGHGAQMVAQAAETQIARRSRLPGPGDPGSDQWKQSGFTRLLVVAVLAGGLVLFVRTRLR
jgi:hypothetical protein